MSLHSGKRPPEMELSVIQGTEEKTEVCGGLCQRSSESVSAHSYYLVVSH